MNDIDNPIVVLLKTAMVNTEAAAQCLGKSPSTVRRYARSQGSGKLRNRGADGSFRFSVYDVLTKRKTLKKQTK